MAISTKFTFNLYLKTLFLVLLLPSSVITIDVESSTDECDGGIKCVVNSVCLLSNGTIKECTDNSFCDVNTKNTCQCSEGYLATSYGSCLPGIGTSCEDFQCNEEASLVCSEEGNNNNNNENWPRCSCLLEGTHWSYTQLKCVASEGSSCSEVLGCTDNASCNFDFLCHCNKGLTPNGEGHCLPGHGTNCASDAEHPSCNSDEFLECNSSQICNCQSGYTWDGNICRALPGQKCDLKVTTDMRKVSRCISSAKCIPGNVTGDDGDPSQLRVGSCQCPSGTEENETGDITCSNSSSSNSFIKGFGFLLETLFLAVLITRVIF